MLTFCTRKIHTLKHIDVADLKRCSIALEILYNVNSQKVYYESLL